MSGWRTSSRSCDSFNCVEVATGGIAQIRDSKDPDGPVLTFAADDWRTAMAAIRAGAWDRR